jgi:hypothetical protein
VRGRRPAYTLLEVLLAMAISLLLLGALYVAMDMQLRLAQDGRDKVEESQLARAMLNRIVGDISPGLRPEQPPMPSNMQSMSGGGGGGGGGGAAGAGGAGAAAGGGAAAAGGAGANPAAAGGQQGGGAASTPQSSNTTTTLVMLSSVQGDGQTLNIITTRVPREVLSNLSGPLTGANLPPASDQRVVSYWIAGSGDSPLGLARREIPLVTSDDAQDLPPGLPDEGSFVIAPEVKSLSIRYFDPQTGAFMDEGSRWPDDATGYDGTTPFGPPPAIELTIEIAAPRRGKHAEEKTRKYTQVVFIPTANGVPASVAANGTGTGTTGSTNSSP